MELRMFNLEIRLYRSYQESLKRALTVFILQACYLGSVSTNANSWHASFGSFLESRADVLGNQMDRVQFGVIFLIDLDVDTQLIHKVQIHVKALGVASSIFNSSTRISAIRNSISLMFLLLSDIAVTSIGDTSSSETMLLGNSYSILSAKCRLVLR
jgi:hypothetical protein